MREGGREGGEDGRDGQRELSRQKQEVVIQAGLVIDS